MFETWLSRFVVQVDSAGKARQTAHCVHWDAIQAHQIRLTARTVLQGHSPFHQGHLSARHALLATWAMQPHSAVCPALWASTLTMATSHAPRVLKVRSLTSFAMLLNACSD